MSSERSFTIKTGLTKKKQIQQQPYNCVLNIIKIRSIELERELNYQIEQINRDAISKKFSMLINISEDMRYRAEYEIDIQPQIEYATRFYNQQYSLWFNSQYCESVLEVIRENLKEFRESL